MSESFPTSIILYLILIKNLLQNIFTDKYIVDELDKFDVYLFQLGFIKL